jgi:endonuclease YncB( thermonuclease family)
MGSCISQSQSPDLTSPNIQPLSLNGEICLAYITDVYDGDTCTANIQSKYGIHKWKLRMNGYDTPELKSPNETPEYRIHAKSCAIFLRELINNRTVILQCFGYDKWGRVLANVYMSHNPPSKHTFETNSSTYINVNQYMIENTPAIPYTGKTKSMFVFNKKFSEEYMQVFKRIVAQERAKLY